MAKESEHYELLVNDSLRLRAIDKLFASLHHGISSSWVLKPDWKYGEFTLQHTEYSYPYIFVDFESLNSILNATNDVSFVNLKVEQKQRRTS